MSSSGGKKKARIYRDEVKERHTSHWDMDLLSQEDFDLAMRNKAAWQIEARHKALRTILGILTFGLFLCFLPTLSHWLRALLPQG